MALAGTRGLAFGGGPFPSGLANDLIYLLAVGRRSSPCTFVFALMLWGALQRLKSLPPELSPRAAEAHSPRKRPVGSYQMAEVVARSWIVAGSGASMPSALAS